MAGDGPAPSNPGHAHAALPDLPLCPGERSVDASVRGRLHVLPLVCPLRQRCRRAVVAGEQRQRRPLQAELTDQVEHLAHGRIDLLHRVAEDAAAAAALELRAGKLRRVDVAEGKVRRPIPPRGARVADVRQDPRRVPSG